MREKQKKNYRRKVQIERVKKSQSKNIDRLKMRKKMKRMIGLMSVLNTYTTTESGCLAS